MYIMSYYIPIATTMPSSEVALRYMQAYETHLQLFTLYFGLQAHTLLFLHHAKWVASRHGVCIYHSTYCYVL